ncbi:fumarylacetoacetate hydrolase family protein [Microbulbifer thermotolerans]|nr:fumarylacetoacetate hydrolase family protein [Microbulbifer thermotolerans]MCX2782121.1 fumarylacetoacetate hydrolase family protein [Microbulbifer thermotolerans]MCX2796076.1 fumarylacetoacetate hydrolase family protein [Microbulbifer thermotolerans]MCX2804587.1 fumarylacetoacetate hydrolase family protein [Microbulbifer thermotolerans]MCX2831374.1 fumarylacetoacetate hydrolase family protein [Microbulbifer thermotolerans]
MYRHHYTCGTQMPLSPGKIVCVGRNYAAHAAELGNPVPEEPLLFIKPATAAVPMAEPIRLPAGRGSCHFEGELALLIGERLTGATPSEVPAAIAGLGLALDLTLRQLQSQLKKDGHPWEKAKGFDGACPLSPFVKLGSIPDWGDLTYSLWLNGELRQRGETALMLTPIPELVAYISAYFTLMPGDVVLTGTPAGVGELQSGDRIAMQLEDDWLRVETRVD